MLCYFWPYCKVYLHHTTFGVVSYVYTTSSFSSSHDFCKINFANIHHVSQPPYFCVIIRYNLDFLPASLFTNFPTSEIWNLPEFASVNSFMVQARCFLCNAHFIEVKKRVIYSTSVGPTDCQLFNFSYIFTSDLKADQSSPPSCLTCCSSCRTINIMYTVNTQHWGAVNSLGFASNCKMFHSRWSHFVTFANIIGSRV